MVNPLLMFVAAKKAKRAPQTVSTDYTARMKIVKYFTLVALAAATLGVSACCESEKAPPPAAPSLSKGLSK